MKQTRFDLSSNNINNNINSNTFSLSYKSNHIFVKFGVCFLLLGLAYRLFSSSFVQFPPVLDTTSPAFLLDQSLPPPLPEPPVPDDLRPPVIADLRVNQSSASDNGPVKCDIFNGDWVPDPTGPFYTNSSCSSIEEHQNCMKNGRPDSGYIYWRWSPRDCELPKFNPERFLDLMWNKSMAFIGDSIMRNYVQSLLCILSQVEQAVEVYHDEEYRSRRWHFPSVHFTLSVIWSPFLTQATIFEDYNGVSSGTPHLHLDKPNPVWVEQYKYFDYIMIAGGKWFLKAAIYYENDTIVGCHSCPGKNLTELGFEYAYRKALKSSFNFITSSKHKAYTFFRTITPDHFENGEWDTGGICNRTVPFKEGEVDMIDIDAVMNEIELEEFEKAAAVGSENGVTLKLLNTAHLSLLRPDGHPGPYRAFHPFDGKDEKARAKVQRDCLHWCLPGPIDTWNDLILNMLLDD